MIEILKKVPAETKVVYTYDGGHDYPEFKYAFLRTTYRTDGPVLCFDENDHSWLDDGDLILDLSPAKPEDPHGL